MWPETSVLCTQPARQPLSPAATTENCPNNETPMSTMLTCVAQKAILLLIFLNLTIRFKFNSNKNLTQTKTGWELGYSLSICTLRCGLQQFSKGHLSWSFRIKIILTSFLNYYMNSHIESKVTSIKVELL